MGSEVTLLLVGHRNANLRQSPISSAFVSGQLAGGVLPLTLRRIVMGGRRARSMEPQHEYITLKIYYKNLIPNPPSPSLTKLIVLIQPLKSLMHLPF